MGRHLCPGRKYVGSHDINLHKLLKRLEEKGLTVSKRKSQLKFPEVKLFVLIFLKDGVRVSDDKVKALCEA